MSKRIIATEGHGFARLDLPFDAPTIGKHSEATRAWRALDHFQIPLALGFAPGGQFLATIGGISPDFLSRGTKYFSPASRRQAPFVSCMSAGVTQTMSG